MKTLIILSEYFPPGFRSGGPARSCLNLSIGLSPFTHIKVLTRDSELSDTNPYNGIDIDQWFLFKKNIHVLYASKNDRKYINTIRNIKNSKPDVYYLNGMYSIPFTIFPIIAHWFGQIKGRIVLAPRGMLKDSALQFKPLKKKVFLLVFRLLGWHNRIIFHATSINESTDVKRIFGENVQVQICPQVPEISLLEKRSLKHKEEQNTRLCLIGRIHPIKQIHLAIQLLGAIKHSNVILDIIGPAEDKTYTEFCRKAADELPGNIQVRFLGEMPAEQAHEVLAQCDFFYLLTQGENFGHAIFEALALGKPVIISDQTPWRNLETLQAGWDLSLQNLENIQMVLNKAATMNDDNYQIWSDGAFACACKYVDESNWLESYMNMFFRDSISTSSSTS